MANFNVRISDDLADRFDAWAATEGGRSPALRLLIDRACAGSPTRRADRLPHRPFKLTVRLTAADGDGLAQAAAEMGLTPNAWVAALVRRRLHNRPTFRRATRMGVTNPENGPGAYIKADPCETIWACMKRLTGWFDEGMTEGQFHRMDLRPAEFYPRMARPIALADRDNLWTPALDKGEGLCRRAPGPVTLLVRKLEAICQTVQPSAGTLQVFGHEIRNLLVLAATEAEMHMRGILKANGSTVAKPNTNQYVKLADPLKLRDYAVSFQDLPHLAPVRPFSGWLAHDPTDSLAWYGLITHEAQPRGGVRQGHARERRRGGRGLPRARDGAVRAHRARRLCRPERPRPGRSARCIRLV